MTGGWLPSPSTFAVPYGEGRPESNPNNSPTIAGFQLNFVRGGAVFSSHVHHWATDVVGWGNFIRQLADNCRAIHAATSTTTTTTTTSTVDIVFPPWDPACIDVSRFTPDRQPPADSLVDGPAVATRHPGHPAEQQALLFHLPRSRAARLKALAQPAPQQQPQEQQEQQAPQQPPQPWVSTYDAMCGFVWRHLTRARIPLYRPDPDSPLPWFGESVDMRGRFRDPTPPRRMIRNMLAGAFSEVNAGLPLPTVRAAAGTATDPPAPLADLALYVRRMTDSVTQRHVEALLSYIATLRDQQSVSFNLMSKPPMSFFVTDHRPADVTACDFGFGAPLAHRFLTGDELSANMTLVYPASRSSHAPDSDEGTIWSITVEKAIVPALLKDPEWCEFFEYRGID